MQARKPAGAHASANSTDCHRRELRGLNPNRRASAVKDKDVQSRSKRANNATSQASNDKTARENATSQWQNGARERWTVGGLACRKIKWQAKPPRSRPSPRLQKHEKLTSCGCFSFTFSLPCRRWSGLREGSWLRPPAHPLCMHLPSPCCPSWARPATPAAHPPLGEAWCY